MTIKKISEQWSKVVEKSVFPTGAMKASTFESNLSSRLKQTLDGVITETKKGTSVEDAVELIWENRFNSAYAGNDLQRNYSTLHECLKRLQDQRRQAVWASITDWGIQLVFRLLTAIGIAAVVLTTGYIAHKCNIPIPLLRLAV